MLKNYYTCEDAKGEIYVVEALIMHFEKTKMTNNRFSSE